MNYYISIIYNNIILICYISIYYYYIWTIIYLLYLNLLWTSCNSFVFVSKQSSTEEDGIEIAIASNYTKSSSKQINIIYHMKFITPSFTLTGSIGCGEISLRARAHWPLCLATCGRVFVADPSTLGRHVAATCMLCMQTLCLWRGRATACRTLEPQTAVCSPKLENNGFLRE